MFRYLISCFLVVALSTMFGCSQAEKERQAVVDESKAVMAKVLDSAKLDTATLRAGGKLRNPMYVYDWFGGTGIYSRGSVQIIGVEIEADVAGAGNGTATPDKELRATINSILTSKDMAEIEKDKAIREAILTFIGKANSENPTSQPTSSTQ